MFLLFQAVMLPQRYFSMLNLNVIIVDLNDNTPIFPANTITVNVSENAQLGSPVSLNQYQATDSDSGTNDPVGKYKPNIALILQSLWSAYNTLLYEIFSRDNAKYFSITSHLLKKDYTNRK